MQCELRLRPIRRQHMDRAALRLRRGQASLQLGHRCRVRDAGCRGTLRSARQRTGPHLVVDIGIVCEQGLLVGVRVKNEREVRLIEPAEVREAAVLPEVVRVVAKVHRTLAVAEQEHEAGADAPHQGRAAFRIGGGLSLIHI